MTTSDIRVPGHLFTNRQWYSEAMTGQSGSSHLGLLEKQQPQTRQKYTLFENHTIMA